MGTGRNFREAVRGEVADTSAICQNGREGVVDISSAASYQERTTLMIDDDPAQRSGLLMTMGRNRERQGDNEPGQVGRKPWR